MEKGKDMLEFIKERQSIWDWLAGCGKPVVLYGMGDGALKIMAACQKYGIAVEGIFASDGFVRGHQFQGYPVLTLGQMEAKLKDFVVLLAFAVHDAPTIDWIHQIAQRHTLLVPDVPVVGEGLFTLEYLYANQDKVQRVYEMWEDDRSRQIYADLLNFKVSGKLEYLDRTVSSVEEDYTEILRLGAQEDYMDIGAYDGDTILEFLQYTSTYHSITALEPDPKNFKKLLRTVEERRLTQVRCLPVASYSQPGKMAFAGKAGRNSALNAQGKYEMEVDSIDHILAGAPVSYIKMDVEGAERETLLGACQTLKQYKPKLNISAYHRNEDLFDLPLLVHEMQPDYRLLLRRHQYIPAWEILLYAI